MLELAVLRHTGNGEDLIDVGLLAETLLFYQRVHVILDGGTLNYLVKNIGPDLLLELLDFPGVSASFLRDSLGTVSQTENNLKFYNFAQFRADPPLGESKSGMINGLRFKLSERLDRASKPGDLRANRSKSCQTPRLGRRTCPRWHERTCATARSFSLR
jgi:hypothetical protein